MSQIIPQYEIYLYEAEVTSQPFELGEAALGITKLEGSSLSSPIALLNNWTTLTFTRRVNKPDNHQIRFDLAADDPQVDTIRDSIDVDSLIYIFRTNPLTGDRELVYGGLNRTIVDQIRTSGSIIINLYGSGPTHMLKRRVVHPPAGTVAVEKSGNAEDIMKEFVEEHAASPTDSDRTLPGLLVQPDQSIEGIAEYSANDINLFTVISRCSEQSNVDFKIIPKRRTRITTENDHVARAIPSIYNGVYHDGMSIGIPETQFGRDGYRAEFSNDDDHYIDVHTDDFVNAFNGFYGTVILWMRVPNLASWTKPIFQRPIAFFVGGNNLVSLFSTNVNYNFAFRYVADGTINAYVHSFLTEDDPSRWFPIGLTWDVDQDKVITYIDGVAINTETGMGTFSGSLTRALIGANLITGAGSWDGYLSHVAVYKAALTASEMLTIANNPTQQRRYILSTQPENLIAYWPLDDRGLNLYPGVFEFQTAKPWGRNRYKDNVYQEDSFIFDINLGNMNIPIFSKNSSEEINFLYLKGAGQDPNAIESTIYNEGRINKSPWNRIELFKSFPRATSTSELNLEGIRLLEERQAQEKFTFNINQTEPYSWPDKWDLGDVVTAQYAAKEFLKQISELTVLVTAGAEGSDAQTEVISAEVDDYSTGWILGYSDIEEETELI